MDLLKGAIGGTVGGVIGAVVWGLIAYYGNVEISWIAIGIGALVGFGVAVGMGGKGGAVGGAMAVVIALASIAGGKYATVQLLFKDVAADTAVHFTDEDMLGSLVVDAAEAAEKAGRKIDYKNGKNEETAEAPADYPDWVVAPQRKYYQDLTEQQRADLRKIKEDEINAIVGEVTSSIKSEAFASTFSLFDILWGLLAILSAWRVGSSEIG